MKILVIEDDVQLRELMVRFLKSERYIVETAENLSLAKQKIALYEYDCILVDIMLPDGCGLDLLDFIRSEGEKPGIIITSAKDSVSDKINGLEMGADDYLPKPFHLSELNARIRSVIRRNQGNNNIVEFGNINITPSKFEVSINGNVLDLSRKEYDLLYYFVTHHGNILRKEQIAEAVWGDYMDQCDNFDFIYSQIKNLRHKLDDAKASIGIKSIYGFGYKIVEKQ